MSVEIPFRKFNIERNNERLDRMKTIYEINPRTAVWLLFAAGMVILALTGCSSETKSGFVTDEAVEDVVVVTPDPLKLLAIGVEGFGDDVSRQWGAQRDGELKISHVSLDEFSDSETMPEDVDLVVHPASISVDLISRKLIREVPSDLLRNEKLNRTSILQHFRKSLVRHDDKTWSVSLGGHQLWLLYRKDVLAAAGIELPSTWSELSRAIDELKTAEAAKEMKPILVPTADSMAAQVFMARVASSIRDQGKLTSFFDRKTMKPMITLAPFEAALKDLKAWTGKSTDELSNAKVFADFAKGKSVFAICLAKIV